MNKITLLLTVLLITTNVVNAQKIDPKHENHFKQLEPINTDEYTLTFSNAHAQMEFCLFSLKITNNTNDFLIFKREETTFNFEFGTITLQKKEFLIKPNGSKKKTLKVDGDTKFHVENCNVNLDGFYIVPIKGTVDEMEDFQVPASKNSVSSGSFDVKLNPKKTYLKTQESVLLFEATYKGNEIGLVDPSKIVIKVNGTEKEYANDNAKSEIVMLKKGEKIKFKASFHIPGRIADMQFANMTLLWKDTFVETKAKKLKGQKVDFVLDPGLTNGKNK